MDVFEYNISNQADNSVFEAQCDAIEKHIPGLTKAEVLEDVDGTMVQRYSGMHGTIVVKNDKQTDALYVVSDFDLLPYFEKSDN